MNIATKAPRPTRALWGVRRWFHGWDPEMLLPCDIVADFTMKCIENSRRFSDLVSHHVFGTSLLDKHRRNQKCSTSYPWQLLMIFKAQEFSFRCYDCWWPTANLCKWLYQALSRGNCWMMSPSVFQVLHPELYSLVTASTSFEEWSPFGKGGPGSQKKGINECYFPPKP